MTIANEAHTPLPEPPAGELTIDDALRYAMQLHQADALEAAATIYGRILEVVPDHPDALHLLGMVRHRMGQSDEGVAMIEKAIAQQPDFVGFHNNIGNIYTSRGEVDKALSAYERASALAPEHPDLHNNLGALYKAQRRFEEAKAAYERALALNAQHINALNNLGLLYAELGDRSNAISYYVKALELLPGDASARKLLGTTYYAMGRIDDAAEVYRQWLSKEPDHPTARHMYAACTGQGVPDRAADDYVEHAFDQFAASFESVLNERLNYQAPQLCADMMARHLPPAQRQYVMLDAGCGTGLCGPLMKPWAQVLAGVDLSKGMLDQAQTKGAYDDLYKAELTEFLTLSPRQWDVVVSADTLCYFGDLRQVVAAASGSLKPGGLLVFTVEALPEDSPAAHQIQPHGRYAHSAGHIVEVLSLAGLNLLERAGVILREEGGKPVHGWLVAARQLA
ncbi:MAG: tetratricopeptide repeat protein [Aquabacterium sp.]